MMNILHVNMDLQIIYKSCGVLICKDTDEFNKMLLQEKKRISERDYVLDRFEHWEVDSLRTLKMILVSRCRNSSEKNLVLRYMQYMNKENI